MVLSDMSRRLGSQLDAECLTDPFPQYKVSQPSYYAKPSAVDSFLTFTSSIPCPKVTTTDTSYILHRPANPHRPHITVPPERMMLEASQLDVFLSARHVGLLSLLRDQNLTNIMYTYLFTFTLERPFNLNPAHVLANHER